MQEAQVGFLGQEDPLPGGGDGNPLRYSCLENPMDRGPWPVTVHEVPKELNITERLNNKGATRGFAGNVQ